MKMNIKNAIGLAAIAGLFAIIGPAGQAQAFSLANPGSAFTAKFASESMTTDVHWRRHRGYHRHHGWRHRYHRRHRWY